MKMSGKKCTIISVFLLCIEFVICRYLLFSLHGTSDIFVISFWFCLIVIGGAAVANARKTMLCASLGYIASFIIGAIFRGEYIGAGGMTMDNFWIWFVCGVFAFAVVGIVWNVVSIAIAKR